MIVPSYRLKGIVFNLLLFSALFSTVGYAEQASFGPSIAQKTQKVVNDTPENGSLKKREEFYNNLQTQLSEFDSQIEKLKMKGDELREKARSELLTQLEYLQAQKEQLLPRIEQATRSSEAAWEDIKSGLNRAIKDLKVALDQAASNFF